MIFRRKYFEKSYDFFICLNNYEKIRVNRLNNTLYEKNTRKNITYLKCEELMGFDRVIVVWTPRYSGAERTAR
jgi:hypothetical protein